MTVHPQYSAISTEYILALKNNNKKCIKKNKGGVQFSNIMIRSHTLTEMKIRDISAAVDVLATQRLVQYSLD